MGKGRGNRSGKLGDEAPCFPEVLWGSHQDRQWRKQDMDRWDTVLARRGKDFPPAPWESEGQIVCFICWEGGQRRPNPAGLSPLLSKAQ